MSTTTLVTYNGACHCRAFKYSLKIPLVQKVLFCKCSLCTKKSGLWVLVPNPEDFIFTRGGYDALTNYSQKGMRKHYFCTTCGTHLFREQSADMPGGEFAVNVRTFDNFNIFDIEAVYWDGRSLMPGQWEPPKFNGTLPTGGPEHARLYTGGCHCGAVTVAVKTGDLEAGEVDIKEDNCSVCQKHGNVMIYPHRSQVSIDGTDNTVEYLFGRRYVGHVFCKTCGIHVYMAVYPPSQELVNAMPPERYEALKPQLEMIPLRVAVLEDVDMEKLKVRRTDEGQNGYVVD